MAEKKYLTKEWFDKLTVELQLLKTEKLPWVLQRLKDAIWQWDISENSEYETAIAEKDLVESRILEIGELLSNVEIIKWKWVSTEVKYSSKVKLEDEKWKTYEFTMVGSWEVDILADTISFDSPVWVAIKWKKKWDIVNVRSPRGRIKMKILEIK